MNLDTLQSASLAGARARASALLAGLADAVRCARDRRGWSHEALATFAAVEPETVALIEDASTATPIDDLDRVVAALGQSLEEMSAPIDGEPPAGPRTHARTDLDAAWRASLAQRVVRRRTEHGWSREEACRRFGLSTWALVVIETGRSDCNISIGSLAGAAELCGSSVTALLRLNQAPAVDASPVTPESVASQARELSLKLADALYHRRNSAGLTRESVASRAGLTLDTVRMLEQGRSPILERFFRLVTSIAALTDVTVPDLIQEAVARPAGSPRGRTGRRPKHLRAR